MILSDIFKKKEKRNIDLLPKEEKASHVTFKDIAFPVAIPLVGLGLFFLIFLGLLGLETTEEAHKKDLDRQLLEKNAKWQRLLNVAETIEQIKTSLQKYNNLADNNKKLQANLLLVRDSIPNTLVLTRLDINNSGSVKVDGTASDPNDIYQFLEYLKNKPENFSEVKLDKISFQSSTGFSFNFSFKVVNGKTTN